MAEYETSSFAVNAWRQLITGATTKPTTEAVGTATSDELDLAHSQGYGLGWNKAVEEVLSILANRLDTLSTLNRDKTEVQIIARAVAQMSDK